MLRDIKVLHLEPTDVCQAACCLCLRETDQHFRKDQQHHLDMDKITKVFDVDRIKQLDKMFMCGNYGDPAAGKHTLEIYKEFRKLNPGIVLGMNTNGGLQNTLWWHELGLMFYQLKDYVVFSIDGLEDTNEVYRKNVVWSKVMANVEAFVSAGGSAHWDMLIYQHNQHQVDACEQLARNIGFRWFRAKVSKRRSIGQLEQPIGWQLPNVKSTDIQCYALREKTVYIDAQGRLGPCCWLGARQKDFVEDFEQVKTSWRSANPNLICVNNCGTHETNTSFSNQWQREVKFDV
jgi:MoaA/NifB/PqqE/SkfB family radical SAM enzyme